MRSPAAAGAMGLSSSSDRATSVRPTTSVCTLVGSRLSALMGRSRRSSPSALHRSQLQAEVRRQCSAAARGVPLVLPPVGLDQASAGAALLLEGVPEATAWGRLVRRSRRALRTCCAEGGVDWPRWYNSKSKSVAVAAISFARSERRRRRKQRAACKARREKGVKNGRSLLQTHHCVRHRSSTEGGGGAPTNNLDPLLLAPYSY